MTNSTVTVSPGASTPSPTIRGARGPHALGPLVRIEQQVVTGELRHGKEGEAQWRGTRVGERRRNGEGARGRLGTGVGSKAVSKSGSSVTKSLTTGKNSKAPISHAAVPSPLPSTDAVCPVGR